MSVAMRVSMVISWFSLPLSMVSMAISTIMRVSMVVIARLSNSNSFSLPLAMIAMAISTIMRVSMVIISRFSISFGYSLGFSYSFSLPLAVVSMVSISTIAMVVVSWFSNCYSEEGKRNSNQKIHVLVGLNSSETPH